MPRLLETYSRRYGLFGVTLALVGWLLAIAFTVVAATTVATEFDRAPDPWHGASGAGSGSRALRPRWSSPRRGTTGRCRCRPLPVSRRRRHQPPRSTRPPGPRLPEAAESGARVMRGGAPHLGRRRPARRGSRHRHGAPTWEGSRPPGTGSPGHGERAAHQCGRGRLLVSPVPDEVARPVPGQARRVRRRGSRGGTAGAASARSRRAVTGRCGGCTIETGEGPITTSRWGGDRRLGLRRPRRSSTPSDGPPSPSSSTQAERSTTCPMSRSSTRPF